MEEKTFDHRAIGCLALERYSQQVFQSGCYNQLSHQCVRESPWKYKTLYVIEFFWKIRFISLLAVLGLCCCPDFSLDSVRRAYSPVVMHELLTAVASLVVECCLQGCKSFSSCGARAQQL